MVTNLTGMHIWEQIPLRERRDLLIAWLALSAAFTLVLVWGQRLVPLVMAEQFIISLLTVGVAFIVHEMAHKFTAMKFGYWAEFQMNSMMLVVAVAMAALVGIVFAAPGATVIYGNAISREENGKISLAGPLSNLVLIIPFALLMLFAQNVDISILFLVGFAGIKFNAMIAAFNLLPLGPLDGAKILQWNPVIFAGMILVAFGVLYGCLSGFFLPF
ncbi:MAG: peptidase M50 [Methanospirillum sp.]|nr:peptidase M50 [Methanospirillum sp.]